MSQSRWWSSAASDDSSSDGSGIGAREIMLFGVRVKVDPLRKSVSLNNLSQYEEPAKRESFNGFDGSVAAADIVYASADDGVRNRSGGTGERKRGILWSEEEHKLFLKGLQEVGKGDWRGISRNFVKTRTPTQVASHAQKYFLRRTNVNRRRRRSSLFDITTDSVVAMPLEKNEVKKENKAQVLMQSSITGGPKPLPTPNPTTRMDLNVNRKYKTDPLSISLNLSLSYEPDPSSSSYRVIPGFKNGDGMISVN